MSFLSHYLDSATDACSEYNGGTGTGMCRYQTPIEAVSTMEVRELVCVGTRYL